jgi:hypothetical protein
MAGGIGGRSLSEQHAESQEAKVLNIAPLTNVGDLFGAVTGVSPDASASIGLSTISFWMAETEEKTQRSNSTT